MKKDKAIRGIEIIRTVACIAIILYHINPRFMPGGFLDVTLFFVLSGYLAVHSLVAEWDRDGDINLGSFIKKRFKRLAPSLYIMIAATLIFMVLFNKPILESSHKDAFFGLTFTTNWWYIFRDLSYFDSFSVSPFKHLWYLGVLFQSLVILAIIFKYIYKKENKRPLTITLAVLSLLSFIIYIIIFDEHNISRVYYGTDTRLFEFFLGALTALFYPVNREKEDGEIEELYVFFTDLISIFALGIFIGVSFLLPDYTLWIYPYGILAMAILTCVLIVAITTRGNILTNVLSSNVFSFISDLSYDLYIWHYPVLVLTTTNMEIGNPKLIYILLRIIGFTVLSILIKNYIEDRSKKIRNNNGFFNYMKVRAASRNPEEPNSHALSVIALILLIMGFMGIAMPFTSTAFIGKDRDVEIKEAYTVGIDDETIEQVKEPEKAQEAGDDAIREVVEEKQSSELVENEDEETDKVMEDKEKEQELVAEEAGEQEGVNKNIPYDTLLVIGDSLAVNIGPSMKEAFGNTIVDGKVSRQLYKSADLVAEYADYDSPTTAVIFMLGSNGSFRQEHIDAIVEPFKKSDIFFVNVKIPDNFEDQVNEALTAYAEENPEVTVIDWHSVALEHPEYLAKDKLHLMRDGVDAMIKLIFQALQDNTN